MRATVIDGDEATRVPSLYGKEDSARDTTPTIDSYDDVSVGREQDRDIRGRPRTPPRPGTEPCRIVARSANRDRRSPRAGSRHRDSPAGSARNRRGAAAAPRTPGPNRRHAAAIRRTGGIQTWAPKARHVGGGPRQDIRRPARPMGQGEEGVSEVTVSRHRLGAARQFKYRPTSALPSPEHPVAP